VSKIVLDASAMLVYAREEPGWKSIDNKLDGALMSAVNYSEVLKKSIEYGGTAAAAASLVSRNRVQVIDFDAKQGHAAAEIWAEGKPLGLAFADRACLALALSVSGTVYTADRRMAETTLPIKFIMVRDGH
jgi:ribonuclease VapC